MTEVRMAWAPRGAAAEESEVAIIADILRASTVITTLLAYDAEYVLPLVDVDEAIKSAGKRKALLVGERNSLKIDGFDFGNSPVTFSKEAVSGKPVIFSSTNFPKACLAAEKAAKIYIGCFLNISRVVKTAFQYARENDLDICFVLAGSTDTTDKEDLAFAASSADLIVDNETISLSDELTDALHLIHEEGMEKLVAQSEHAERLKSLGFTKDVHFAMQKDIFPIVPYMTGAGLVRLEDLS